MCPHEKAVWKDAGKGRDKACPNVLKEQAKFWMEESTAILLLS